MQFRTSVLGDQLGGIPVLPVLLLIAQITGETFDAPGTGSWIADRSKGRDRLVKTRILQGADESTMSAHTVAGDATDTGDDRKIVFHHLWQLLVDIRIHSIILLVLFGGGINIEAGTSTKIPIGVLAFDVTVSWTSVGSDHHQLLFGRVSLKARLDDKVLLGASQSRKPIEDRHAIAVAAIRWQVRRKFGLALQLLAEERVHILQATKGFNAGHQLQSHFGFRSFDVRSNKDKANKWCDLQSASTLLY